MYKDFELKNDPHYHCGHLRGKIRKAIKNQRDETVELHLPSAKQLPIIPVTGAGSRDKYLDNKSRMKLS